MPASASPAVSAKIPNCPEMFSALVSMVILPPASVLVLVAVAVALISAFGPMFVLLALMTMFPALPALLVSTDSLVLRSRVRASGAMTVILPPSPGPSVKASIWELSSMSILLAWRLMVPAFPAPVVEAAMSAPFERVRFWERMLMLPALPVLLAVAVISPSPLMLRLSGDVMKMFPPLPLVSVNA